jgi:hypothetical protein
MKPSRAALALLVLFLPVAAWAAGGPARKDPKEALKAFNDLVGAWRGTGEPEGTRAEKLKGFWTEGIAWAWQFKGEDVWLRIAFDKGKYFRKGELRYVPGKDVYRLTVTTADRKELAFEGPLEQGGKRLTLDREDPDTRAVGRLVFSLLHPNRYLYRYEVKLPDRATFARVWQVGATKKGVPFAGRGDTYPECVVSGGRGTIAVSHKGKTYHVCCTGCRDEFHDHPEKYIREYEERLKKEKVGK